MASVSALRSLLFRTKIFQLRQTRLLLFKILAAIGLVMTLQTPAGAQAVTWTMTDIGSPGASGTYSFSSGTYTVGGAGSGISDSSDNFTYVSTPTSGNVEIIAKVTTQTNTSNYANAGLMFRSSLTTGAATAMVGVTPGNGVNFTYRTADGQTTSMTLGPSIASPVYLRLVRSQNTIAGYQSSDGISWSRVGDCNMSLPAQFFTGFAVASAVPGTLSTATFTNENFMVNVPQRSSNLAAWYRADAGVIYSGTKVSQLIDHSGNGNNADQPTATKQPTLVTSALNGLPAIAFNGSSQYFQIGTGMANFDAGASVFIVTKPTTITNNARFFDFGNGATNNNLYMSESTTNKANLFVYSGSTASSLAATGALTAGSYQVLEAVHNGAGAATIYTNGTQKATGAVNNITNVARTGNYIGTDFGKTLFYNGQLAEVLVYNAPLTDAQRIDLESYFLSKYGIGSAKNLSPPTISPGTGVYSSATEFTITSSSPGAAIYYTTDGSTPTTSSTLYSGPFTLSSSATINAIAWQTPQFYGSSPVASALVQIDPNSANVRRAGMQLWLKADAGVTTSGANVTQWLDMSGNNANASQTSSGNRPTLSTNSLNGLPAIQFNGSNQNLNLPSGFTNFAGGASAFVVLRPTAVTANSIFFEFGTTAASNNNVLALWNSATSGALSWTTGSASTSGSVTSGAGGVAAATPVILDVVQDNAGNAIMYKNGAQFAAGSVPICTNVLRTLNTVGCNSTFAGTGYYNGKIAELLVYNAPLSATERSAVEAYLRARYGFTVQPPTFNIQSGVYNASQSVSISADPGASIYYTTDGTTPTTSSTLYTGPLSVTTSASIKAIASQSYGTSTVSSVYVQIDPTAASVPRSGLNLWLRADSNVLTSGTSVTQWSDLSGSENHATQTTAANRPTVASGAVNGLPAIAFSGSSQYLQLPSGLSNFTAGASVYVVTKPTSIVNKARFFDFGNGATSDNLYLAESTSPAASVNLFVYNSAIASSLNSAANKLIAGSFQILEAIHNGAGSASIYTNNVLDATGTVSNITNISRASNYIGIDAVKTAADSFNGQIAEILIYSQPLTSAQREAVESYLHTKYNLATAPTLDAPTFSVQTGTYGSTQTMVLSQDLNASIYYTTDGTTPTTSSTLYTQGNLGFPIYGTTTVKAIAAAANYSNSPVSSVTITIDPKIANVPRGGLLAWYKSDYGVFTSGSSVTNWWDFSGNNLHTAQGTATRQPTLVTNSINGYPSISFDGTSDGLQMPSGFANFTAGASIFIVANPTTISMARRLIDFGQGPANSDNLTLNEYVSVNTGTQLIVYTGSTGSGVATPVGFLPGAFQVLEAIHSGAGTATLYTNGTLTGTGAINNITNINRLSNVIGCSGAYTDFFSGKIAEILIYNTALSATDRTAVENYLLSKYGIATPTAPTITPNNQVFSSGPQTVTITAQPGAQIYYTTDGTTPTTSSTPYYVPFTISSSSRIQAVSSFGTTLSPVTSSYIQIDSNTAAVPRTGLAMWLKADYGVLTASGNVTNWTDMSGSGNTASQTTAAKRPALVLNAVNGLPTVSFDGSADFLQAPAGLADFTQGVSAFVVAKPSSIVNNARFFDFGNAAASNNVYFSESTPNSTNLFAYNGTTASSVTASNAVTASQYQLLEAIDDGAGGATLLTNGSTNGSGLVNNLVNTSRSGNYIATNFAKSLFYGGEIAEVIIYNTGLTPQQRASVESYLAAKYAISATQPVFSPGTGVYYTSQTVSISAQPGATVYYTTDGSTPTTGSTLYTAPIEVDESTTLKAIAVQTFGTSSVSSAYIQIDPNSQGVPVNGLSLWLKSDYGVQTTGSSPFNYLSRWIDMSGSGNDATPNANAPYLSSASAVNGYPAVFSYDTQNPPPNVGTLQLPMGFRNFDNGANIFVVTKSQNSTIPTAVLDLGNGTANDNLRIGNAGAATTARFNLYTGSTNHTLSAATGLPTNLFELVEAQQSGTTGYITSNGVTASGALPAANHVTRSLNNIFTNSNGTSNYLGAVAEILVYEKALSSSERAALIAYLNAKYQFTQVSVPDAPIISVPTSTLPAPFQVAIASQSGTQVYYTTDGTTPSTSSTLYTGPVRIIYTTTLKAIAVRNESGLTSSVSTATYTLDANQWPAPGPGGPPLQFNLELPTTVP